MLQWSHSNLYLHWLKISQMQALEQMQFVEVLTHRHRHRRRKKQ
jgi:hypothetical protein